LVKDIDLAYKLAARLTDAARDSQAGQARITIRLVRELDVRRQDLVEQLKQTVYFERQAYWLLSRFPEAKFVPVPGLCRVVTQAEIEAADWSLTPGRYVGTAPPEVDSEFDFEQALREIHEELAELNQEASALAVQIHQNFAGLNI
jgi:type I restriction enzyme M protein